MKTRVGISALAMVLALGAFSRRAEALHRFTNIHGSSCEPSDPPTELVSYSDLGIKVKSTAPPQVSLVCPAAWSQDFSVTPLQKMVISLYWYSVPISAPQQPVQSFNPSCMFHMVTTANTEIAVGVTSVVNPGTENPVYVFVLDGSPGFPPLPAYGTVAGSAIYCNGVPPNVGIYGYTIDTCFAGLLTSC